jgi:hypothetical protein
MTGYSNSGSTPTNRIKNWIFLGSFLGIAMGIAVSAQALELQPRRWGHLPIDINFAGGGYAYTDGDIFLDPVLQAEDVTLKMDTWLTKYVRSFELFNKSALFDVKQAYQEGRWSGLLEGEPASTERKGLSDPVFRLAVILYGAPPLKGKEYRDYQASAASKTRMGVSISAQLPLGDYHDDKLINLGSNRYTFRPQLGIVHETGKWSFEATGTAWLFTENDDFFNGNKLEQDPLYTLETHVVRNHKPGVWTAAGMGYSYGGESKVNGIESNNRQSYFGWGLSFGYSLTPKLGISLAYGNLATREVTGSETESISVALSAAW